MLRDNILKAIRDAGPLTVFQLSRATFRSLDDVREALAELQEEDEVDEFINRGGQTVYYIVGD